MSVPSGNSTLNIRNLGYFQALGPNGKLDPQKMAEALDDIQTAYSALEARIAAMENVSAATAPARTPTPAPFVVKAAP